MKQLNLFLIGLLLAFNGFAQKEFTLDNGKSYMDYGALNTWAGKFVQNVQPMTSDSLQFEAIPYKSLYGLRGQLLLGGLADYSFMTVLRIFFGMDRTNKLKLIFMPDIARKKGKDFLFDIRATSSAENPATLIPDQTTVYIWNGKKMVPVPFMDYSDSANSPRTWVYLYQKNIRINKSGAEGGIPKPFVYGDSLKSDTRGECFKFQQLEDFFKDKDTIYITHIFIPRPVYLNYYKHAIAFSSLVPDPAMTQSSEDVLCSDLGNLCPVRCDLFTTLQLPGGKGIDTETQHFKSDMLRMNLIHNIMPMAPRQRNIRHTRN